MTDHVHGLTEVQVEYLLRAIDDDRIKHLRGQSHVESWDDRRTLIRAFGFGGYNLDRLACDLVDVNAHPQTYKKGPNEGKPIPDTVCYTVIYRYEVRLTVKCSCLQFEIGHWDEVATGDAVNQPSLGDAHDQAVKGAASQALKRAAINLGDQFGLSLYNKDDQRSPVVRNTALRAGSQDMAELPTAVTGGELDDPADQDAAPPAGNGVLDQLREDIKLCSTTDEINVIWTAAKAAQDKGEITPPQGSELGKLMSARGKEITEQEELVGSGVSR